MNHTRCLLTAAALIALLLGPGVAPLEAAEREIDRPNIVFIMADDLGKEWIGCYGAEDVETPRLDALAEGGMRLTHAYSMPQCTPTRVTLLTGQYPYRHGWVNHWDVPRWGSGCHFDPDRNPSLPRRLRKAGYATAIAGKWQIDDFRVEPRALDEAGFDDWCVWTGGEGGNIERSNLRYHDPYIHTKEGSRTHKGRFGPDVFTDFLVEFMADRRDEPMMLYYPMVLTHRPYVTTPDAPNASGKRAKFKAMVRYTDKLVGRLVDALEEHGLRRETIIIFTTDNGSPRSITGHRNGHAVRGAKAQMREPGTAMPFIVNGPGIVPSGVVSDALTDFTDLLPTFTELAGTEPSDRWETDGVSIAPLLTGRADETPRDWILSMGGHAAEFRNGRVVPAQKYDARVIRDKRWKLWVSEQRKPVKLYDMQNDPWEQHNLIDSDDPAAQAAKEKLSSAVQKMPKEDAAPRYEPNPPQPWDRADYEGPEQAQR